MHPDVALAKSTEQQTPPVITTPTEYRQALARWGTDYNVLTPFTNVSGIAQSFGIIATVVKINHERIAGEVYSGFSETGAKAMPFLKGERGQASEEFAIAKIGLRKLAECGGISTHTERTDDRRIQNYWEFRAIATYRGLDGSLITREATFEWDLRNGSDRLKGWTSNQITEGRKNGLRNCEARAINAAIRECGCGIKQKYTRAELDRPFVVIRVAFQPDMNDAAVKQAVTMRALEGTGALYGQSRGAIQPIAGEVVEDVPIAEAPRQVGSGSTESSKTTEPTEDKPPTPDAVRVMKVEEKSGETKGRKWIRYAVIDSNGVAASTFDKQLADAAREYEKNSTWVEISTETQGEFTNLIEITPAGQQPSLLPNASDL